MESNTLSVLTSDFNAAPQETARRCPNGCGFLSPLAFQGIQLDTCHTCAGLWFDASEVPKMSAVSSQALQSLENALRPSGPNFEEQEQARVRRCPTGHSVMLPFTVPLETPVTLDRCSHCEGIWADDQELAALHAVLEAQPTLQINPTISGDLRDEITTAIAEEMGQLASDSQTDAASSHFSHAAHKTAHASALHTFVSWLTGRS